MKTAAQPKQESFVQGQCRTCAFHLHEIVLFGKHAAEQHSCEYNRIDFPHGLDCPEYLPVSQVEGG